MIALALIILAGAVHAYNLTWGNSLLLAGAGWALFLAAIALMCREVPNADHRS